MRTKKGIVAKQAAEKTIVVEVYTYKNHPKYKKRYRVTKKFQVHNPENKQFEIGEKITIYECRPISKTKCWTTAAPELTPNK